MIRDGYSEELDQLRDIVSGGKGTLARHRSRGARKDRHQDPARRLQPRVRLLYRSLKGPDRPRSRRPTSASRRSPTGERYITPELKELERTILTAKDRITALEYELFSQVRQHLADQSARIQRTARAVAALDVLTDFAALAARQNYCRPEIDLSGELHITDGRHPVVEQVLKDALFVPNDTALDCGAQPRCHS